jgi:hypothetical protein
MPLAKTAATTRTFWWYTITLLSVCRGTTNVTALINYRIAMNSIATRYLSSGWRCRFPLRSYDALAAQRLFRPFERCCRNQFAARVAWS